MKLRRLELKDAPLMLEWMHDQDVVEKMQADFASKTIEDCKKFIQDSQNNKMDLNLAIVDEQDIYMGTVSLKNITEKDAEFAITIRKVAMGTGISTYAIKKIIEIGLNKLNLEVIYWYVAKDNYRAIRFYDKNKYKKVEYSIIKNKTDIQQFNNPENYEWYIVMNEEKDIKE